MRRILSLTLLLLISTLFTACSSPKVITNADPSADFDSYRTYGFVEKLGTDNEGYQSLLTQFLMDATSAELQKRGYTESGTPDLLVNFYVNTTEKVQSTTAPPSSYYGYRGYGGYGGWGTSFETTTTQYTEGTLSLDLIDRGRMQLIWEGAVIGTITDKVRENMQESLTQAMGEIFKKFPHTAPSK